MEVRVEGKEYEMPVDLYIPPHALQVILETTFEGPLDLLLYLIRRHNFCILYTYDAADDLICVDHGGLRTIINKM